MIKEDTMREAGQILHSIFDQALPHITAGCSCADIDSFVGELIQQYEARSALKLLGFPGNISICLNTEVLQGIPHKHKVIQQGDLVSLDMTLYYKGFFVDKAVSVVVEPAHYIKRYLVTAVEQCFQQGLQLVYPNMVVSEIGKAINQQARTLGVQIGREFFGHSIGESHHMPPLIPNFDNGATDRLRRDTFLTIEPIVFYGNYMVHYSKHEISANVLSAHKEETVLVTPQGAEIIT